MWYVKIFIVLICFWGCRNENRVGTIKAIEETVVNTNIIERAQFSDLFQAAEYIPLRSGIFNELRKVQISQNRIYISSTTPAALWRYDMSGNLVDSLFKQGKGPGEYSNIRDFNVFANGEIYILSRTEKKILIYNSNFEHKGQFSIPVYATAFHILDDHTVMLYCVNENILSGEQVIVYDWKDGEIIRGFFPMDEEQRSFINVIDRNNFVQYKDTLFFTRGFDNTIYQYSDEQMNPWLTVNFGNATLPQEYLDANYENVMDFYETIRATNFAFRIIGWTMSQNYAMFNYEQSGQFYLGIMDLNDMKVQVHDVLEDDMVFRGAEFQDIVQIGPYSVDEDGDVYFFIEAGTVDFDSAKLNAEKLLENSASDFTGSYILKCRLKKDI